MSWGFISYSFLPERPEEVDGLAIVLKNDAGRKADSGWSVGVVYSQVLYIRANSLY
jgi:hypothetical protein